MPKSLIARSLVACLAGCGLLLLPVRRSGEVCLAQESGEAEPPINVSADRMDYHSDQKIVVFTGNALAVREDVTLSADRMEVTLAEGGDRSEGSVREIVATGNVNFRQVAAESGTERFATSEKGEYTADGRKVTLTGEPRVWEGRNAITAERLVFFLDENRFVAEGKVGLRVFPDKPPEEK